MLQLATNMQNADKVSAQNINQQAMVTWQPPNAMNRPASKDVKFALLVPVLEQQLDKDRAMQLQGLYERLRSNYINKEEFVRKMRSLVGDHMLKMSVYEIQQGQLAAKPNSLPVDKNAQKQRLLEQSSGHWPMAYAKHEPVDQIYDQQHKSQLSISPGHTELSKDETVETMSSSRPGFSTFMNKLEPMSIIAKMLSYLVQSAGNFSLAFGSNAKTTVGQKKPLEAPVISLSKNVNKKQKVTGAFSYQSTEQLNRHSHREEEEQLFSGTEEEEEILILQKTPFQKQLDETMTECGVKNRSCDVERCLSLLKKVQAELEKEREARQNIEARFEQFEQERAQCEQEREQERVEREREREQERAEREREKTEQAEWRKNMEEMLKKFLNE